MVVPDAGLDGVVEAFFQEAVLPTALTLQL